MRVSFTAGPPLGLIGDEGGLRAAQGYFLRGARLGHLGDGFTATLNYGKGDETIVVKGNRFVQLKDIHNFVKNGQPK